MRARVRAPATSAALLAAACLAPRFEPTLGSVRAAHTVGTPSFDGRRRAAARRRAALPAAMDAALSVAAYLGASLAMTTAIRAMGGARGPAARSRGVRRARGLLGSGGRRVASTMAGLVDICYFSGLVVASRVT